MTFGVMSGVGREMGVLDGGPRAPTVKGARVFSFSLV